MDPSAALLDALSKPEFSIDRLVAMNSREMFKLFREFNIIPSVRYWLRFRRRVVRRLALTNQEGFLEDMIIRTMGYDDEYVGLTVEQRRDLTCSNSLAQAEMLAYCNLQKQLRKTNIDIEFDEKADIISVNFSHRLC